MKICIVSIVTFVLSTSSVGCVGAIDDTTPGNNKVSMLVALIFQCVMHIYKEFSRAILISSTRAELVCA